MSSEGINKLAQTIQGRIKELGDKPPVLDIGTIQSDMSLLTNKFPMPIPRADYLVCRSVTWGTIGSVFCTTSNQMNHTHDVLVGDKYRGLQSGDRVLVAWIGDDACVVDIVG